MNLVAVAALGDALMGFRLRAGTGAPEPEAGSAFEKFLAGLIGDFLRAKS